MGTGGMKSRRDICVRCFPGVLIAILCQVVSAAEGMTTGTSAGGYVTAGKYGALMSLGQSGPVEISSSPRYRLMSGHVPATLVSPDMAPPVEPVLTGAVENQAYQVSGASLASLLEVRDPDGIGFTFEVSALAGELQQGGVPQASVVLGRADSVDWLPAINQSGSIDALSVVMRRGEYPDKTPVTVGLSVAAAVRPVITITILTQKPLRLAVRHEASRRYIVEQSEDLNQWVPGWERTGSGQWDEIEIPLIKPRNSFRVRSLD